MNQVITRPKCPFCDNELNSSSFGYELMDVSFTHRDLRFVDIFYCRKCGAVLNITKSVKHALER